MVAQQIEQERVGCVDPGVFRQAMSTYPTGVTVITAEVDGELAGMTANSFTSVSLDPPMVLFCAARTSSTWPRIQEAGSFVVNLMSQRGADIVTAFATSGIDRFAGVAHSPGITGAPVLAEADTYLECVIESTHIVGDHAVAVGRVLDVGGEAADAPLIFHRSKLRTVDAY